MISCIFVCPHVSHVLSPKTSRPLLAAPRAGWSTWLTASTRQRTRTTGPAACRDLGPDPLLTMESPCPHTFGPACRLAPVEEPGPDDALLDSIPPINAQFFYHSLIPIDDPLSTATVPTSTENKPSRAALRPFSHADNNALERAWLSLASKGHRASHRASLANRSLSPLIASENYETLQKIVHVLVRKHKEKHAYESQSRTPLEQPLNALANTATPVCCQELLIDASIMMREAFCEVARRKQRDLDQEHVIEKVMAGMEQDRPTTIVVPPRIPSVSTSVPRTDNFVLPGLSTSSRGRASSLISNPPASRSASIDSRPHQPSMSSTPQPDRFLSKPAVPARPLVPDDGISGKPFIRVGGDVTEILLEQAPLPVRPKDATGENHDSPVSRQSTRTGSGSNENMAQKTRAAEIPVGVSKLHMVSLPALQMKPIYWSPVNDVAIVSRATWFYRWVPILVPFSCAYSAPSYFYLSSPLTEQSLGLPSGHVKSLPRPISMLLLTGLPLVPSG